MPTRTSSGQSSNSATATAVREAISAAAATLEGKPTAGFVFTSAKHDLGEALKAASAVAPGCEFMGCQSAGEFTEKGRTTGGVAVLLTTLDRETFSIEAAPGVREDPTGVAKKVTSTFSELQMRAARKGAALSTSVLLVDGLAGTGERVVKEVLTRTRLFQQVVGGASGDDGQFKATQVGTSKTSGVDSAAVMHVFGKTPWGVGVDHGLKPKTKTMLVTRAEGNVVYEIDKRPAIEVYREYAKSKGIVLDDANTGSFLIGNELGVFSLNELNHARAPMGVGPAGELKLVAEIAQGAQVCILDGEIDSMVKACGNAARQARANLQGAKPAGVLVFDCICRGMILKDSFQEEIDAVKEHFPEVPIAGFLTYGEIARFSGKLDGWHNTTTVVVALPA